jgi:hypothetical protein
MEIPPQITVSIKPDLYQSVLNTNMFKPGSTIKLKVLELKGDRALIGFGNFRATADIKIPVTLGEELLVRVQELGRQLKLNLLNPEQLKTVSTDSILRSVEYLTADLESFDLKENGAEIVPRLKAYVDVLLADIDHQQGRADKQLDTAQPFQVFTLALPLKDDNHAAGLKIYYQKKPKAGLKKRLQISLLLSMDRLGDLRTDFYLLGKDLTVTFFVKDRPTKTKLQENYSELQQLLTPFFDQLFLRVIVSEKKIKDFDHEDFHIDGDRRVDLRI